MSDFILSKGEIFNLTKEVPTLDNIYIGAGWRANEVENGYPFDIDLSLFLVDENNNMVKSPTPISGFVGHIFPTANHHGFTYGGDDKQGTDSGDAEFINGRLSDIGPEVHRVIIAASIHCWRIRQQSFDKIRGAYVTVRNADTDELIRTIQLTDIAKDSTSFIFGSFVREGNDWMFKAESLNVSDGMRGLFNYCGMKVAEETK